MLIQGLSKKAVVIQPQIIITEWRDPKDNIVLECAMAGLAEVIVTGDQDLLILNPFNDISIVTPKDFQKILESLSRSRV